jgi:hypothetical protein
MSSAYLDPPPCLQGILEDYFVSSSADKDIANEDVDSMKCVSEVKTQLLELLTKDEYLDLDKVLAEAEQAKAMPSPRPQIKPSKHSKHMFPCANTFKAFQPSRWPQAPLMICPTSKRATKIRGLRRASSMEYEDFCVSCILPTNCGSEASGDSLVVDFELPSFIGTLPLSIKHTPRNVDHASYTKLSYFDGKIKVPSHCQGTLQDSPSHEQICYGSEF